MVVECSVCGGSGREGLLACRAFCCFWKPCPACGGTGRGVAVAPVGPAPSKGQGKARGKGKGKSPVRSPSPRPRTSARASQVKAASLACQHAAASGVDPLTVARLFSAACEKGDHVACGKLLADDVVFRKSRQLLADGKSGLGPAGAALFKLFRQASTIRDWEVMEDATYVLKELDEEWFRPPRGTGKCKGFDDFHQKPNPKALAAAVCSETGGLLIGAAWDLASVWDVIDCAKRNLNAVQRGELKAMTGSTSILWPPQFQTGLLAALAGSKIVAQTCFVEKKGKRIPMSRQLLVKDGLIVRIMWWFTGPGRDVAFRVPAPKLDPDRPLVVPDYWQNQGPSSFHETISSAYITKVADGLLTGTFRRIYTRDRFGEPVPKSLKVVSAFRVEDAALWQRYDMKRAQIREQCSRWRTRDSVKTDAVLPKRVVSGLDARACEAYLFHGTSPDAAMGITKTGFCIDLAGAAVGTAFGKGAYFAECSSKSDEYAKAQQVSRIYETAQAMEQALSQAKGSLYALILCRVCLGRVCRITEFDQEGHLRVLGSEVAHTAAMCEYDSLLGDREAATGTYREFIVYHPAQAYPEYVILYEREY